jgi:hypothetical protein
MGLLIIHEFCQLHKIHPFQVISNEKIPTRKGQCPRWPLVLPYPNVAPPPHPPKTRFIFLCPSPATLDHGSVANSLQDNPARLEKNYFPKETKFGSFGNKTLETHLA